MPKDFGYFGKGLSGYTHYMQAFDRNHKKSGGGGNRPRGGCATTALLCLLLCAVAICFR